MIPALFGGVCYHAVRPDSNGFHVLRDRVDSTHDALIVSLEKHGDARKYIDESQELIARQMFPQRNSHCN